MDIPIDKYDLTVGFFVLISIIALAALIVFLSGGDPFAIGSVEVKTYIAQTFGINKGTPVTYLDMQVGKVKAVHFSNKDDPKMQIEVVFSIRKKFQPRITNKFSTTLEPAQFGPIISGKLILKAPEIVIAGARLLVDGDKLPFKATPSPLEGLQDLPKKIEDEVLPKVNKLLSEFTTFMEDLNNPEGDARRTLAALRQTTQTILDPEGEFMRSIHLANELVATLIDENNTVIKLLNNEKLYDDITATVSNVRAISDKGALLADETENVITVAKEAAATADDLLSQTMPKIEKILQKILKLQDHIAVLLTDAKVISTSVARATMSLPTMMSDVETQMKELEEITRAIKNIFIIRWNLEEKGYIDPTLVKPLLLRSFEEAADKKSRSLKTAPEKE